MFPKVPQSSLGILKAPQLPPPLETPPPLKEEAYNDGIRLSNLTTLCYWGSDERVARDDVFSDPNFSELKNPEYPESLKPQVVEQ